MTGTYRIGSCVMDKWIITRLIGEGSFGKVFEIERQEYGQVYRAALKVITVPQNEAELQSVLNEGMSMEEAKEYFAGVVQEIVREFAIMSRLKGTANVVGYEDHVVLTREDGIGWQILIRMELLHPLLQHAYANRMARRDIIKLGIDLCKALELCQKYNIIHRDIKPENIFISDNGDYKLGDFGIARTIEQTAIALSKKGTYQYMAPEVYRGEAYGFSVDTYSLGLVLYRMLNNNRVPFLPAPPTPISPAVRDEAMARRLSGEPFAMPYYANGRLGEIVLKACAADPRDRYSSPSQMRQELEAILYEAGDSELIYPEGDAIILERNRYTRDRQGQYGGSAGQFAASYPGQTGSGTWDETARTESVLPRRTRDTGLQMPETPKPKPAVWITAICLAVAVIAGSVGFYLYSKKTQEQRLQQYEQIMDEGIAMCSREPEVAKELFLQAQELFPEEAAPYVSYSYALYCAGEYAQCIDYAENDLALGKAYDVQYQSQLSEILGAAYFECEDYVQAASFFRLCTAGGDLTQSAQRDYAVSLGRIGDLEAADEVLAEMYAAGAKGDVTDYVQAEVDFAREEYVAAERGFRNVLDNTDDIVLQKRALRSLGEVYRECATLVRTGYSPIATPATKAVEVLAWGIEEFGLRYDAPMWEMLALAYFEAYHTDTSAPQEYLRRSAECFDRVIELGMVKDYLYANLYTVYYELQWYEDAEQALKDYEAAFPEHYEPHAFRAMMLITMENQKDQSRRNYSAAVKEYEVARSMIRGDDDDATYFQQLESLISQLRQEGWIR